MKTVCGIVLLAGVALLSACIEVEDKYTTTLILYSESGDRFEVAKFKMVENCIKSAGMWQEQVEPQYTATMFFCEQAT